MTRAWAVVPLLLSFAAAVDAQVDCDTPDDLCTGDPCVISSVEVDDLCVLDFGSRAVVVAGTLRMPNSGELSLTAGTIDVTGDVRNLRLSGGTPGGGPRIVLSAAGDITYDGRIRLTGVRGGSLPGEVVLAAGGSLIASGVVSAATSPTTITYTAAGGDLDVTGRVFTSRDGGELTLVAMGRIVSDGSLRRLDSITMSAGGDVELRGSIVPRSLLTVDAGGLVMLETPVRAYGADVTLRGAAGVGVHRPVSLIPLFMVDGSLELASAGGLVTVGMPVRAIDVIITAGADVVVDALVSASPPARSAGSIVVESTGGDVLVGAQIRAQPGDGTLPGDGAGGRVQLTAGDLVQVTADVLVNRFPGNEGAPGGTVEITGATVAVGPAVLFDADGDVPGPDFPGQPAAGFRIAARSGDATLDGTFRARGGPSVIEATASGNLVATGRFEAAPGGCIALAAGGTLDTSGATFDTPVVADCP